MNPLIPRAGGSQSDFDLARWLGELEVPLPMTQAPQESEPFFKRTAKNWQQGRGPDPYSNPVTQSMVDAGWNPTLSAIYGYLPDTGLAALQEATGLMAGAGGTVADVTAPLQGEGNADRMARDLGAAATELPWVEALPGMLTGAMRAPSVDDLAMGAKLGWADESGTLKIPGGGKNPPNLRGMDADEAIRIARRNPHLKEGGAGSEGLYVGGPRNVQNRQDLTNIRREADKAVARGAEGGDWYDRYRAGVTGVTENQRDADWMSNIEGQFSAGVSPEGELGFSLRDTNSAIAYGDPIKAARPAQQQASRRAIEANDPTQFQLGPKTGEYARRINPATQERTATGVNDFRHARTLGYTEATGEAQKNAVGTAGHRFMDYETALMVDRANKKNLAGRSDWTGEQIQAAPWVSQKADDLLGRQRTSFEKEAKRRLKNRGSNMSPDALEDETRRVAFEAANTTIADYFPKHTAYAMHEAQPYADAGHLPLLNDASQAERIALMEDPMSRWDFAPGGRDALYSGMRLDDTGYAMRTRPSTEAQGVYTPPSGIEEMNPVMSGRPMIGIDAAGDFHSVDDASQQLLDAAEATRAYVDVQGATPAHYFTPKTKAGSANAVRIPRDVEGPISGDDLNAYRDIAREYGFDDVVDTGDGLTITNFGGDPVSLSNKQLRQMELDMGLPEGGVVRGRADGKYLGYEGAWEQGGGAATEQLLKYLDDTPEATRQALDQNPYVPQAALDRLARDERLAGQYGATRQDIQNARALIGEGPGWIGRLRKGLASGAVLPAIGAMLLLGDEQLTSPSGEAAPLPLLGNGA